MGRLWVGNPVSIDIEVTDSALDRVKDFLEEPPTAGGGFWLKGPLVGERNGEPIHLDPTEGHQRVWIPTGELITLIYDRPLHPDPDEIVEEAGTILIP